jgi:hypothetical protein
MIEYVNITESAMFRFRKVEICFCVEIPLEKYWSTTDAQHAPCTCNGRFWRYAVRETEKLRKNAAVVLLQALTEAHTLHFISI